MRLPGTRYQEPGWEEVRKLLGQCSLLALRACDPAHLFEPAGWPEALARYVEAMGAGLHGQRRSARAQGPGNSYGDTVFELALTLVYELQARPADWDALCTALAGERARLGGFLDDHGADGLLRKKVNDMYAVLRDKVDADNYQAACGRPCSANRIYAYRMLDTAYGEIARLFAAWEQHREQVGAILGRELAALPIEVRQLRGIGGCRPEWVLRWSETLARFGAGPGPLHTRSKRFASLKTSPEKIGAMLAEIGEYEALSANRDQDWLQDQDDAAAWMEDYWRVLQDSLDAATPGPDRILEAHQDALDAAATDPAAGELADSGAATSDSLGCGPADGEAVTDASVPSDPAAGDLKTGGPAAVTASAGTALLRPPHPAAPSKARPDPHLDAIAAAVSLPPGYMLAAAQAEAAGGWVARELADAGLPVRLAVYARLLGAADESYPDAWRDPASGELPTMQQLAALAQVSLPTLRKRRDAAIERLGACHVEQGPAAMRRSG